MGFLKTVLALLRRVVFRAFGALFGNDVFISYATLDGAEYAEELARSLLKRHFACYLDRWECLPGHKLPWRLVRALSWAKLLVVVGTQGAVDSAHVGTEVQAFLDRDEKRRKGALVIDFGGVVKRAKWSSELHHVITSESVATGPSAAVIDRIINAADFRRRDQRQRLSAALVLSSAAALSIGFFVYAGRRAFEAAKAVKAASLAEEAKNKSVQQKDKAEAQRAIAETAAEKANESQERAERDRTVAEERARDAQAATDRAQQMERQARTEAGKIRTHSRSLALSDLSTALLKQDAQRAIRVAVAAVEHKPTPPAVQALREALATYVPYFELKEKDGYEEQACVGAQGLRVVSAGFGSSRGYEVHVWDAGARSLVHRQSVASQITKIVCSARGEAALVVTADRSISYLDARALRWRELVPPHEAATAQEVGFTRNGTTFFTRREQEVTLWSPPTFAPRVVPLARAPIAASLFADHKLITRDSDGGVRIVDLRDGSSTQPASIPCGTMCYDTELHLDDSETLMVTSRMAPDETFPRDTLWSIAPLEEIPVPGRLLSREPRDRTVALADDERVHVARFTRESAFHFLEHDGTAPASAILFPTPLWDSAIVLENAERGEMQVRDPKTNHVMKAVRSYFNAPRIAVDGRRMFDHSLGAMRVYDLFPKGVPRSVTIPAQGTLPRTTRLGAPVLLAAGGDRIVAAKDRDGLVELRDWIFPFETSTVLSTCKAGEAACDPLWAFSATGQVVIVQDHQARLSLARMGEPARELDGEERQTANAIAVSEDGALVARKYVRGLEVFTEMLVRQDTKLKRRWMLPLAASRLEFNADATALLVHLHFGGFRLLDTLNGKVLWEEHGRTPLGFDFAGTRLLTTDTADGPLRVFERTQGGWMPIRVIHGFLGNVTSAAWSRDGRFVVTYGIDRMLRVWDVERENLAWSTSISGNGIHGVTFFRDSLKVATYWRLDDAFRVDECEVCREPSDLLAWSRALVDPLSAPEVAAALAMPARRQAQ